MYNGVDLHQTIDPRLYHDIQVQLNRLIGKAEQLIGNVTTYLAESISEPSLTGGKLLTGVRVEHGNTNAWELDYVRTWVGNGVFMHGKI